MQDADNIFLNEATSKNAIGISISNVIKYNLAKNYQNHHRSKSEYNQTAQINDIPFTHNRPLEDVCIIANVK